MLPKRNRLTRTKFDEVYEQGKKVSTDHLYAKAASTESSVPQVSVVVPKKIAKRATERNQLRRRGYGAVEKYFDILPSGTGVIIFLKSGVGELSSVELRSEVEKLLRGAEAQL